MPKMLILFMFLMILLFMNSHMLMNMLPHPIMMILMILSNTFSICFLMSLWQPNPMYPILLFLIMISGMLIIFLYFSSLITNMQNKTSINFPMMINFMINLTLFIYLNLKYFLQAPMPLYPYLETFSFSSINQNMFKNLFMLYSYPYNNFTFLCMLFLLIVMFITIKMCTIKTSSLRKIS